MPSVVRALLLTFSIPGIGNVAPAQMTHSMPAADRATEVPYRRMKARSFDMQHVSLDLRFDWEQRRAIGVADLTVRIAQTTREIQLDAGHLAIGSIRLVGGKALPWTLDATRDEANLKVTLDRPYLAGTSLTMRVAYTTTWINHAGPLSLGGSTGRGLRFFVPTSTEPTKRRQIWSSGEPQGNRYWYPGHDAPHDLITSDVRVTVETPLMAISNGRLLATRINGDGTRTFHWKQQQPHANHLTSLVVGHYRAVTSRRNGILLQSFGYPDEREAVKASVVRLPAMVDWFSRMTGVPYPSSTYAQVFVRDVPWSTGNSGVPTLTENMIDDFRTHEDYRYLWDGLEAEALAAQWFGGLVSIADWRHAWLNRALAHYFDALFSEHINGRDESLLWNLRGDHATAMADWSSNNRHPIVPATTDDAAAPAMDNIPYARGALVLQMLRHHLGDAAWWRGIRGYVRTNAGRAVTTADFQRAMEVASGSSLSWFFDQWVYGTGHPVFEVGSAYDATRATLTVQVTQHQQPDTTLRVPQARFFEGPVDIGIDGQTERVWVQPTRENTYTFSINRAPGFVSFDRGNVWIKELRFAPSLSALRAQAHHDPDATGRFWALGQLGRAGRDTLRPRLARDSAVSGIHDVIRSDRFWRLRYSGLLQLQGLLAPAETGTAVNLDAATRTLLLEVVATERSWVRSVAFSILGTSRDTTYTDLYIRAFADSSHPVNYAAAIALGQSRSPRAYTALAEYMRVPSWKGENILCGLAGLKALGDPRGVSLALAAFADTTTVRWYLSTSRWDFRMAAAEVLAAAGAADQAWPILEGRYRRSLAEGDVNDVFSNVLLAALTGAPQAEALFAEVRSRYATLPNAAAAIAGFEAQWKAARPVP